MSNYHILSSDLNANSFQVVYHIPIPNTNNEVGTSYRSALVQMQGGAENISSGVPFIDGGELTQLQAGELIEISEAFHSNPGQSLSDKRDAIDARYTALVSETQAKYQNILSYWGYSRDVP